MYYITKNKLTFYLLVGLCILIGFIGPFILPGKYYYDANLIVSDPLKQRGWIESYPVTMMFYHLTRLSYVSYSIVALVQLPILFYILKKIGIPEKFHVFTVRNVIVYLAFLMIAVFISQPSKEFITYLFITLVLFILVQRGISFKLLLALAFGAFFAFGIIYRPYYIFIPFISIGMYAITFIKIPNKVFLAIFNGVLVIIFISLTYGVLKGDYLSMISRENVNLVRINSGDTDTNSIIMSPIYPDTWYGEVVSMFYGFFTVNLPVNGLKFIKSPQIIAFVLWQLTLSVLLMLRLSKCLQEPQKYKEALWVLFFVFAFFIAQGMFEPDLGSAVRHKIGIFPLIYFSLYYEDFRRKLSERL
ncbi:hypothetical protein [Flavobacterium sp. HSC-61S13]|uniref:hypothetical protein n=1 Tax=Flavobacterium sp. HSC-61S13 TaxID=2910963 RepID=UPI00209CFA22|nr:hypothetical protein [Flavobacterium sp. HSC-61S13]MCP1995200.1 hypothetical protein [Flavobacterium sp. HSC-61S13]